MEQSPRDRALKAAIQQGIESGVSDRTVPDIMEDVEARFRTPNHSSANNHLGKRSKRNNDVDSKD